MKRILLVLSLAACGHDHMHMETPASVPADRGSALVEKRCTTCHSDSRIFSSAGTLADWEAVVARMAYHHKAKLFTHLDDDEAAAIARYLADTQKPGADANAVRIGPVATGRPL